MVQKKKINEWMKTGVISIHEGATVKEAANLMLEKKIGTLPVIDKNGVLVGMTTIEDISMIFLPDFVSLLSDIDFVKDFGARDVPSAESMAEAETIPIVDIMKKPVAVETTSGLMRALSVMTKHNIQDLLVTQADVLVGIASRVDICRGFLSAWQDKRI